MTTTTRRRPGLERLEPRSLLSGAGALDPSFHATGSSTIALGVPAISTSASYTTQVQSVVAEPDGQVVVTGLINTLDRPNESSVLSIARFNANGSVDTTFGVGGQAQLPINVNQVFATAVETDGSILEASSTTDVGGYPTYLVVKLTPEGTVDTSFGTNGVAEYPAGSNTLSADRLAKVSSLLLQSNGQIIVAGNAGQGFAAVRLNADGSLDTSYGQAGTALAPVTVNGFSGDLASSAAIQANGQIVIAGTVVTGSAAFVPATEAAVVRLNTDGSVDSTFGTSGSVAFPVNPNIPANLGQASSVEVAVDPTDQRIVVADNSVDFNGSPGAGYKLYRLNADGSTDATFGNNGLSQPEMQGDNIANSSTASGTLQITSNGTIVELLPNVSPDGSTVFRVLGDGSADPNFANANSSVYLAGLKTLSGDLALTLAPTSGDIVLAGSGTVPTLQGRIAGYTVAQILSASTNAAPAKLPPATAPASFDGTGLSNLAVYLPATGQFAYRPTADYLNQIDMTTDKFIQFGSAGANATIPAAADYLGNGTTQIAAYLTGGGDYIVQPVPGASNGLYLQYGAPGVGQTIPVPADYYGNGADNVAVFLTANSVFAIMAPGSSPDRIVQFGAPGLGNSIPAPADYYGTGQDDIAVYLTSSGSFAIQDPSGTTPGAIIQFGTAGMGNSIPVPGDYDGSGHIELAVYIPSQGAYYYRPFGGGPDVKIPIGTANAGDIPVPGDYDGSGRMEAAIYNPIGGFFAYQPANGGPVVVEYFGSNNGGSLPVEAPEAALPGFGFLGTGSGSGSGMAARPDFVPSSGSTASASAIPLSPASAVPAGPTLASIRVALARVNQGADDPSKPTP